MLLRVEDARSLVCAASLSCIGKDDDEGEEGSGTRTGCAALAFETFLSVALDNLCRHAHPFTESTTPAKRSTALAAATCAQGGKMCVVLGKAPVARRNISERGDERAASTAFDTRSLLSLSTMYEMAGDKEAETVGVAIQDLIQGD
ncbi:hypothetical protein B0H14DRAFT_2627688 [Mycena olivaceomarginata]|nr:hypothetical protein B0H14DRAFT_2627688 [Mycena olivaceomarginata]